jgi:tetratricopeptide (TPR) repeat protein
MSVKVASSRFIDFSLRAGFYQQIFSNVSSLQKSGEQLVRTIEVAHSYRETSIVEELGQVLSHHPIKEYRLVGQYYLGWCAYRKGIDAQTVFEGVVEASQTYRTKALWSLAAIESTKGNYEAELKHFIESLKYVTDLPTRIDLTRGIAVVKAKEGYHQHALKDLEILIPSLRYANPHTYYDCLNSYAVELGEAGRVEDALKVCQITLASPFINAYPEWRETGQDLALRGYKSRSLVPIIQSFPGNVVPMPKRKPSDTRTHSAIFGPAPVVGLKEWKEENMVKEPNGDDDINLDKMSEQDMVMKLIQMLTTGEGDEKKIRELLKSAFKIFYGK